MDILKKLRVIYANIKPQETTRPPLQEVFNRLGCGCLLSGGIIFLVGLLTGNGLIVGMGGFLLGIGFALNAMLPMVK